MKNERDPREYIGQQLRLDELTSNPISSNLEREGEIFMPEPGNGEIPVNNEEQNNRPQENPVTDDVKRVAKENWERILPWEDQPVGARRFIQEAIDRGISPNIDTSPNFIPKPLTEDDMDRLRGYRNLLKRRSFDELPHELKIMLRDGGLTREQIEEIKGDPDRLSQAIEGIVGPDEDDIPASEAQEPENGGGGDGDGGNGGDGNGEPPGDDENGDNGEEEDDNDEELRQLHNGNQETARYILEELQGFRRDWRKANRLRNAIDARRDQGIDESDEERILRAMEAVGTGTAEDKPEAADAVSQFQKAYAEGLKKIREAGSFDEIAGDEGPLDNFIYYAEQIRRSDAAKFDRDYKPILDRLKAARDAGDLAGIKEIMKGGKGSFPEEVRKHFVTVESVLPDIPYSLEDLAAYIMRSEGEVWRTGNERELLDAEGRVNKVNFLAWVRKRMIEVHEFSPTQTVDFFSQIYVKSRWSQISLQEMVLTGSYFTEKRTEKILVPVDPNDPKEFKTRKETTYHQNKDYERLRQQLLLEAFLFNTSRNSHVEYVNVQPSEEKLLETLGRLYGSNVFTRSNFLEFIMSMPSTAVMPEKEVEENEGSEMKHRLEKSADVGQAARKLLLAYYYIYDFDTLQEILGEDAVLFAREYAQRDESGEIEKDEDGNPKMARFRGVKGPGEPFDAYGEKPWFGADGKLKGLNGGIPPADFMRYVNVFTGPGPNKDEVVVTDVRQRMVESIMNKMGLTYEDAKYAEAWAFSMTKWTGLAAKNDTGGVGFDAWTKILCTFEYRLRQMSPNRDASYGNIFNVLGMKRLGLNFFEGVRDTNGRTLLEAIQGGEGSDFSNLDVSLRELHKREEREDKEKRRAENERRRAAGEEDRGFLDENLSSREIRFQQQIMGNFIANHVASGFHLFSYIVDSNQLNIQNFVKYENGREIINYEEANKALDGLRKWVRDWLATWAGADYSKTIHTWETVVDGTKENKYGIEAPDAQVRPVDLPVFADLFGRDVIEKAKLRYERQEKDELPKMSEGGRDRYRRDISRAARIWRIAGQKINGKEYQDPINVDFSRLQNNIRESLWKDVFQYLIEAEIESHRNVFSDQPRFNAALIDKWYDFLRIRHFYNEEEIRIMRKNTHSTELGMALSEGGTGVLTGGLEGFLKKLFANLGEITKL